MGMIIVADNQSVGLVASPVVPVSKGTHTTTLTQTFEIAPGVRRVDIQIDMLSDERLTSAPLITYQVR